MSVKFSDTSNEHALTEFIKKDNISNRCIDIFSPMIFYQYQCIHMTVCPVNTVWLKYEFWGQYCSGSMDLKMQTNECHMGLVCPYHPFHSKCYASALSKIITYLSKFICFFWIKSAPSDLIYWVTSSPLFIETQGKLHTN